MAWAILWICSTNVIGAERMAVAVDKANVRSGPGTTYDILWKVEKFHPVEIIKKTGDWYYFRDFEGDRAWIHKSLLNNIKTVIIKKKTGNVRAGPGTDFEIVFTVSKGVPFKVLEHKGQWLHVIHSQGHEGWIHRSLVW